MDKSIKLSRERIHYWAGLLFFFLLPFNLHFFPVIIGIFVISWIIQENFIDKFLSFFQNKRAVWFIILYFLFALSLIYSENISKSFTDLEKKLSLFFMPLIFATANKYLKKNFKFLLLAFLIGTSVNVLISSTNFLIEIFSSAAAYQKFLSSPFWYGYKHLSIFNHSSYFALFIAFSIGILIYFYKTKPFNFSANFWTKVFIYLWVILLSLVCIINSSRAGILALFVFLIFSFFYLLKRFYIKVGAAIILTGFLIYGLSTERFENYSEVARDLLTGKKLTQHELLEKNADRLVLWRNSIEVIKSNFWIGTGNGDIKIELKKRYKKHKVYEDLDKILNPHNQFLSVFVGIGIFGFAYFIFLFVKPSVKAWKERDYLLFSFLILIIIHFLVESMLNRLSGIAFFSSFYSLLYIMQRNVSETE
jgi:O-antigen ligase